MGSPGAAVTQKSVNGDAEELAFAENGGSGLTILAAVVGKKHRIFKLAITASAAGIITISDGFNAVYHNADSGMLFVDFGIIGKLQNTANTAITLTNSGGGNISGHGTYKTE